MSSHESRFQGVPDIKTRANLLVNLLTKSTRQTASSARVHTVAPTTQRFFVGTQNKKAKLIVLQITGLGDEESKKICEKCLLSVRFLCFYLLKIIEETYNYLPIARGEPKFGLIVNFC